MKKHFMIILAVFLTIMSTRFSIYQSKKLEGRNVTAIGRHVYNIKKFTREAKDTMKTKHNKT